MRMDCQLGAVFTATSSARSHVLCPMPEALLFMGAGRGQEEGTEGGFEQTSGITTGVYIFFHKGELCQGVGFLVLLNGSRASGA